MSTRATTQKDIPLRIEVMNQEPSNLPTADQPRSRYLLLDSRVVASAQNAVLRVGPINKHSANPLFVEDTAWEQRFDNFYGNVSFDAEASLYKCWYNPLIVEHSARDKSLQQRRNQPYTGHKNREMGICYATSKDGLCWDKPNLDLVGYDNSRKNNIIWRGPHGAGIFRDEWEIYRMRRYKMIFSGQMISSGLEVSFSADGLTWSRALPLDGINVAGDTHNNALWAPTLNKYVAYTRTYARTDRLIEGSETKTNHRWARQVSRIESADFVHWSPAEVVLEGTAWERQAYAMPVFYHGGVYIGLLAVHDQISDRVWTELAWSPDSTEWHHIAPGTPFIPWSPTELAYDYGCVYACASPVFLDNEIRLFYGGSDYLHFGWRNGCLALATLRPDGFAGLEQEQALEPAKIQTAPLPYQGEDLKISADITQGGSVECRLLDMAGDVVTSGELRETSTDSLVLQGQEIESKQVRIDFSLRSAKLYSFVLARNITS